MDILDICATRTLECGVVPIEQGLTPIYDCYYSHIIGYRCRTYINSILYGTLAPEDYAGALEHDEVGVALAQRSLRSLARAISKFPDEGRGLEIFSVPCPMEFLSDEDIYSTLRTLCRGVGTKQVRTLCLEFSERVLEGDTRRLERVITDIRAVGIRIALRNYGARSFQMSALAELCPDAVFMTPGTVALLRDREKSGTVGAFLRFAAGMGVRVIAEGAEDDGQIRELYSSDCYAYMPSAAYSGNAGCVAKEYDLASLVGAHGGVGRADR